MKNAMSTKGCSGLGWKTLFLPESWTQNLCVTKRRSESGSVGTELSLLGEDHSLRHLVTIYAFTGEKALDKSREEGRFLLDQRGEVCFSALLGEAAGLDQEELRNWFQKSISPDLLPNEG